MLFLTILWPRIDQTGVNMGFSSGAEQRQRPAARGKETDSPALHRRAVQVIKGARAMF